MYHIFVGIKLSHQGQLSEFEELIIKNLIRNYLYLFEG